MPVFSFQCIVDITACVKVVFHIEIGKICLVWSLVMPDMGGARVMEEFYYCRIFAFFLFSAAMSMGSQLF